MKLSDRDLKLLVFVLLVAVIVLPIFFLIRPFNEKIAATDDHIKQLKEREEFLAKLDANRAFYNSSIELLANERTKIIQDFATGLHDENNVFFLAKAEEDLDVAMTNLTFVYTEPTPISEDYVDPDTGEVVEGLTANTLLSTVQYVCEYENMKDLLKFVMDRDDRMVITSFSADQDENGFIKGVFILSQYAVTGEGRSLAPATAEGIPYGVENVFGELEEEEEEPADEE